MRLHTRIFGLVSMRIMKQATFIDLYSGAGLFSAGFSAAGFRPLLALDLSRDAVATYNGNVAPVAEAACVSQWCDIPRCDVLIAGPPCQGFSTLGRRDPLDARNMLALEVVRWSEAAMPAVVVVENVPPFLGSQQWSSVAQGLRRLGYEIQTWVLDAVDFGVPQYRRRAFTIASKVGPVREPHPLVHRSTVADAFATPIADDDPMHCWPVPVGIAAQRIPLIPAKGDKRDLLDRAPELCPPSWIRVGCQATDVWGRMDLNEPANTLRCAFQNPSKGRYLHPTEDRCISLREGARLQGVPDHWQFSGLRYPVARQIGNGVPIPLAKAVAQQVGTTLRHSFQSKALIAA